MAFQNMQFGRPIKRLDPAVVSRIAAGEVVLRPANALKELIENSLDAGATLIKVEVKDGGMKYLQIVDNGCGMRKEDLEMVCERHTTSKMESIADLQALNTYGFRGEALSSISLISDVSILTKTAEEKCGYKVSYSEGKLKGKPVPCAANQGTTITVENMFYNVPLRQKALKNVFEEHKRVQEIVGRYAVHNTLVGFSLKKYGQNHLYINTINKSSTKDVIGSVFDTTIARNLLEKEGGDDLLHFKYKILATNLIYSAKQLIFLLFINHRLVKAEGLQKEIVELYSIYLPPKAYPFIYISLEMPPANVDANVHPRKENVFYLHEEFINKKILGAIQQLITGKDAYQTYKQETLSFSQSERENGGNLDKGRAPSEDMSSINTSSIALEKSSSADSVPTSHSHSVVSEQEQPSVKKKKINGSSSLTNSFKKVMKDFVEQSPKTDVGSMLSASPNLVNNIVVDTDVFHNQDIDFEMAELFCQSEHENVGVLGKDLVSLGDVSSINASSIALEKSSSAESDQTSHLNSVVSEQEQPSAKDKKINALSSLTNSFKKVTKHFVEQCPKTNDGSLLSASPNSVNKNVVDTDVFHNTDIDFEMAELIGDNTITNDHSLSTSVNPCEEDDSSVLFVPTLGALKKNVIDSCDRQLKRLLEVSTFVACSGYDKILIAKEDHLYECVFQDFCREYFYQVIINGVGNLNILNLSESVPLCELFQDARANWAYDPEEVQQQLMKNAVILNDNYSMKIDENGNLWSLPCLLEGYFPSQHHLQEFILKLACDVSWDEEHHCLGDVSLQIASYYSKFPTDENPFISQNDWNNLVEFTLFPAVQKNFWPSKELYLKCICEVDI